MTPAKPPFLTCLRLGLTPTWFVVAALLAAAVTWMGWSAAHERKQAIEQLAAEHADAFTFALDEVRVYYASTVAAKAKANGLQLSHRHAVDPGALPLPINVTLELGEQFEKTLLGVRLRTYSDYPFPWREDTGGVRDEFGRAALEALTRAPDERYYERTQKMGQARLRFARAIVMEQTCVNCHNTHPDSPKRDWQLGDVRAVTEVSVPLGLASAAGSGMSPAAMIAAALTALGLLGMAHANGRREWGVRSASDAYARERLARQSVESTLVSSNAELVEVRGAAQDASEATSQLLATISHELRTPLNAVIGMTSLIQQTQLNEEQREQANVIRHSGDTLLALINDVLDYSKIESDGLEMTVAPFDVRECVELALEMAAGTALSKGVDLVARIDPLVDGTAMGDATRVRQVLVNLINNGVKFTTEGEVVVEARPAQNESAGDVRRIEFRVIDSGIGISADKLEMLFKPIGHASDSNVRRYGGTGLGLAISRRLCEIMGGGISATSRGEEGAGSTFRFDIECGEPVIATPLPAADTLVNKRALIAYGNDKVRELVTDALRYWQIDARSTSSADDAMALLANDDFDLLIGEAGLALPPAGNASDDEDGGAPTTLVGALRKTATSLPDVVVLYAASRSGGAELWPARADVDLMVLAAPVRLRRLHASLKSAFDDEATGLDTLLPSSSGTGEFDMNLGANFPLRILVAEDNMINQRVVIKLLEQMGYRADVADNGREAIAALEKQRYDVILMDVQMPEMDGLEATRHIVQNWAGDTRPHVVALTASATQADREECLAAGMDDFITKPIRVAHLTAALRRAVER